MTVQSIKGLWVPDIGERLYQGPGARLQKAMKLSAQVNFPALKSFLQEAILNLLIDKLYQNL